MTEKKLQLEMLATKTFKDEWMKWRAEVEKHKQAMKKKLKYEKQVFVFR